MKINYESRLLFEFLFFYPWQRILDDILLCLAFLLVFLSSAQLASRLVWLRLSMCSCLNCWLETGWRQWSSVSMFTPIVSILGHWPLPRLPQPQNSNTPIIQKSRVPSLVKRKEVSIICMLFVFLFGCVASKELYIKWKLMSEKKGVIVFPYKWILLYLYVHTTQAATRQNLQLTLTHITQIDGRWSDVLFWLLSLTLMINLRFPPSIAIQRYNTASRLKLPREEKKAKKCFRESILRPTMNNMNMFVKISVCHIKQWWGKFTVMQSRQGKVWNKLGVRRGGSRIKQQTIRVPLNSLR